MMIAAPTKLLLHCSAYLVNLYHVRLKYGLQLLFPHRRSFAIASNLHMTGMGGCTENTLQESR